ncbi:MAG: NADH-quinone oxidoreductase subunit NuoH [Candidatus Cloacimonadota bacterium]|nr:MAG: NADH-quinone oxidoreductase subunit NuoH [Candidatus Cloacimonadota bacterium]
MILKLASSITAQPFLQSLIYGAICSTIILSVCALCVMSLIFLERKVSAWMQSRLGPNRVGPRGLLQMVADGIKLIRKEDIVHDQAMKFLFNLAPCIAVAAPFAAFATIPFSENVQVVDFELGIVYVFALTGFSILGILIAGYASVNRYSLLGALRATAQMISYEIPMIIALLGVLCFTETLSLRETVIYQQTNGWNILYAPISFIIFFIAATAECNRAPFDLVEAESELVAGFHTEYAGIKFAMFFFGEYVAMMLACSITVILFLGGWLAPFGFLPFAVGSILYTVWGLFWFVSKVAFLLFVMMWFRWTFPRLRIDQLMVFCWKVLIPFSMVNLLIMAVLSTFIKG